MSETSIHEACGRGDIAAVRALIAADPTVVDADDEHGWRPSSMRVFRGASRSCGCSSRPGPTWPPTMVTCCTTLERCPTIKRSSHCLSNTAPWRPMSDRRTISSRQLLAAVFLADTTRIRSLLGRHPHLATVPDGHGDQAIHHAARNGDTEIVRLLVEHGADVNAKNTGGQTVLYCAGGHGHLDTLQLLLSEGADRDARFTPDGKTLMEWLAQYPNDPRFTPIAEALRRHEAGA